jgi:hypothetical protein
VGSWVLNNLLNTNW